MTSFKKVIERAHWLKAKAYTVQCDRSMRPDKAWLRTQNNALCAADVIRKRQ